MNFDVQAKRVRMYYCTAGIVFSFFAYMLKATPTLTQMFDVAFGEANFYKYGLYAFDILIVIGVFLFARLGNHSMEQIRQMVK